MLGIWGGVLLFITSLLFLAHAAMLASRVSGRLGGRFPHRPLATRRGEAHTYTAAGKKKHAGFREDSSSWVRYSPRHFMDAYNYWEKHEQAKLPQRGSAVGPAEKRHKRNDYCASKGFNHQSIKTLFLCYCKTDTFLLFNNSVIIIPNNKHVQADVLDPSYGLIYWLDFKQ